MPWHYVCLKYTIISFEYVDFWPKICIILYNSLEKLTTHILPYFTYLLYQQLQWTNFIYSLFFCSQPLWGHLGLLLILTTPKTSLAQMVMTLINWMPLEELLDSTYLGYKNPVHSYFIFALFENYLTYKIINHTFHFYMSPHLKSH